MKNIFSIFQHLGSIIMAIGLTAFGITFALKQAEIKNLDTIFEKFCVWFRFPSWFILLGIGLYLFGVIYLTRSINKLQEAKIILENKNKELNELCASLKTSKFKSIIRIINSIEDSSLRDEAKFAAVMGNIEISNIEISRTADTIKVKKDR